MTGYSLGVELGSITETKTVEIGWDGPVRIARVARYETVRTIDNGSIEGLVAVETGYWGDPGPAELVETVGPHFQDPRCPDASFEVRSTAGDLWYRVDLDAAPSYVVTTTIDSSTFERLDEVFGPMNVVQVPTQTVRDEFAKLDARVAALPRLAEPLEPDDAASTAEFSTEAPTAPAASQNPPVQPERETGGPGAIAVFSLAPLAAIALGLDARRELVE